MLTIFASLTNWSQGYGKLRAEAAATFTENCTLPQRVQVYQWRVPPHLSAVLVLMVPLEGRHKFDRDGIGPPRSLGIVVRTIYPVTVSVGVGAVLQHHQQIGRVTSTSAMPRHFRPAMTGNSRAVWVAFARGRADKHSGRISPSPRLVETNPALLWTL